MVLPNFLIVGAPKSGTTSAYEYLRRHPEVFMPERKEPRFFSSPEDGGIGEEAEYRALFRGAEGKKAIGEASTLYLYDPDSPRHIRATLGPEVKIVAFLRNPVDLAYSFWGFNARVGKETLSFREALAKEEERMTDPVFARTCVGWVADYAYTARAKYADQLERYYVTFEGRNIKVFIFEEFFLPGLPLYPELCRFLGVSDDHVPDDRVHNPAGGFRSAWLRRVYRERMAWKEPFKLVLPRAFRRKLMKRLNRLNLEPRPLPPLDPDLRKSSEAEFGPDVRRVERIIGRDLSKLWF